MNLNESQIQTVRDVLSRYMTGRIDRRRALKLLGALGLTTAAAASLGKSAAAHQEAAADSGDRPARRWHQRLEGPGRRDGYGDRH